MTAAEELVTALKTVISNVYPDFYDGSATKYIVYNLESSVGTSYADDSPEYEDISYQIHIYCDEKPTNYKKSCRKALFDSDFSYPSVDMEDFDKASGMYHIALSCEKITNNDL